MEFKNHKIFCNKTSDKVDFPNVLTPESMDFKNFKYKGTGKNVRVCIIGSGVPDHPSIWNVKQIATFTGGNKFKDEIGISTIIGGIIGANEKSHVVGLAPDSHLYFAKITDEDNHIDSSAMEAAILWAAVLECNIVVISHATSIDHVMLKACLEKANDSGLIIIVDGTIENTLYPQNYNHVIHSANIFSSPSERGIICSVDAQPFWSCFLFKKYAEVSPSNFTSAILGGLASIIYEDNLLNNPEMNTLDGICKQLKECI